MVGPLEWASAGQTRERHDGSDQTDREGATLDLRGSISQKWPATFLRIKFSNNVNAVV